MTVLLLGFYALGFGSGGLLVAWLWWRAYCRTGQALRYRDVPPPDGSIGSYIGTDGPASEDFARTVDCEHREYWSAKNPPRIVKPPGDEGFS